MTPKQFHALADAHGMFGRTREALELVLVTGVSAYRAAKQIGISQSAISRAKAKLEAPHCRACHRPL